MPKVSPKEKARKLRMVQQKRLDHGTPNLKYWLMGIVGVAAIVGIVVALYYFGESKTNQETNKIETGDNVTMHYRLWIDDNKDGQIDISKPPYQETESFKTDVYSVYHEGLPPGKTQLIHGFYLNLLGKVVNQSFSFRLEANVDANGDYIDDVTNKVVVSYTSGELANTSLYFWVKILNIEKGRDESSGMKISALNDNPIGDLLDGLIILERKNVIFA